MVNGFLNTIVALLMAGATLSFNFKAVEASGNVQYDGTCTVTAKGDSYRLETKEAIIVSNGTVKGIYQKSIDEIVLQSVGEASASMAGLMDNPLAFLKDADKYYEVTTWKDGKKVSSGAEGSLPDKIELKAKSGAHYTIGILSSKKNDMPDGNLFVLNLEDYPYAVVTDLR